MSSSDMIKFFWAIINLNEIGSVTYIVENLNCLFRLLSFSTMRRKFTTVALSWGCYYCLLACINVAAQTPQPGFASVMVSNQWNEVVGLTFTNDGVDMFVWERGGRVYTVTGGIKRLVLDISEEVGAWHDHGLLGFALHPQFEQNGYIYLLYLVDRHHLINYGTAAYSPTVSDYFSATIGRLTRYTLTKSGRNLFCFPGKQKDSYRRNKVDRNCLNRKKSRQQGLWFLEQTRPCLFRPEMARTEQAPMRAVDPAPTLLKHWQMGY